MLSSNCTHGNANQCTTEVPQVIDIQPTFLVFNGSGRASDTTFPDNSTIHPAISNLAQIALAAMRIDLGQIYPNNPLVNLAVINDTLYSNIGSVDSLLYGDLIQHGALKDYRTPDGPVTINRWYACRMQIPKPIGSAIISVLVATLSMFTTGWTMFIFVSSSIAECVQERQEAVEQELVTLIPPCKGEVPTETRSV